MHDRYGDPLDPDVGVTQVEKPEYSKAVLAVGCPICDAPDGQRCVWERDADVVRFRQWPHNRRKDAARARVDRRAGFRAARSESDGDTGAVDETTGHQIPRSEETTP